MRATSPRIDDVTDAAVLVTTGSLPALPGAAADRLASLTEVWLARQRSAHTRVAYRRDLLQWLGWCAENQLDPLTARMADVDAWIVAQRAFGARGGRPAAESTIARRVSAVASWYAYLVANTADDPIPMVTRNPARAADRPRVDADHSDTVGLSRAEADRLLEQARLDSPTSYAVILLLLLAGLRVGSAITAQITDLGTDRGHRVLDVAAKGGKRRRVPLPPVVSVAIDAMLTERANPPDGPLFVTTTGAALYELSVHRLVRRLAHRADIAAADKLSPHSLRHTAITELLDATGGDLRKAQRFAGHADPRTTLRYDRARQDLNDHGAYLLAGRYTTPTPDDSR